MIVTYKSRGAQADRTERILHAQLAVEDSAGEAMVSQPA
jgi:hypothetical protein